MLRIAEVGILLQLVLQTGIAGAICCDDIRSDIENRTVAYNVLCAKGDPHLGNCCRVIDQDLRKHKLSYRTLCPNHEINYCKSNPCHPNATCVSHSDSFTCTCKTGYTGSGLECTDIDECQQCDVNAICNNTLGSFSCTCVAGYTGDGTNCTAVRSCADLYKSGVRQDGVYTIDPDGMGPFAVRCDMTRDGGGWTVFQRRQNGSEDFYRGWSDYKAGFGDLGGEFWLGLDKIHRLTKSGQDVLRVDLMDFNDAQRYAKYETFSVADESDKYRLNIRHYSGDAGDSLDYHNQMQFSSKDSDNDYYGTNCAVSCKGAWWYKSCHNSNLNGLYLGAGRSDNTGIRWYYWQTDSLKKTEMKIRPNQF